MIRRPLTPLQIETLRLAAQGLKNRAAAEQMGTTEGNYVRTLQRARYNLNAENTAHAIHVAWQKGILP